ncbi:unnamed protein product [Cyberlindnera jadinii]|uniref:Uncharacterized protein n=1 Tax=Cyberlindnera jadinii (strain ATCC 18201 / CBS 1600 / BCRC 20928 / JCM 3617 / NBRC 0987 / NRRL Y-1542) TaxID=983966 RepID=A0A0H5C199_CYBJN|nr:unnamed protein product [Cyberlindnera jadinii]
MTDEPSFEDIINDKVGSITDYIEEYLESHEEFDPFNLTPTLTDLSLFDEQYGFKEVTEGGKNLYMELTFSKVLANFINLRDSENNYNYRQISLLLELSLYLKKNGEARFDLPYILVCHIISGLTVTWLLEFWPYFDLRSAELAMLKDNERLSPTRSSGVTMMIMLNLKLRELNCNNEPKRDLLKDRILLFTAQIFELFNRSTINKRFDQNLNLKREHHLDRNESGSFFSFWDLQEFFQDPLHFIQSFSRPESCRTQIESAFDTVRRIEEKIRNSPGFARKNKPRGNSLEIYEAVHFTDEQKARLVEYSQRGFNPLFLIDKEKFNEQLENDTSFRKIFLVQLYISLAHVNHILFGEVDRIVSRQFERFKSKYTPSSLGFFKDLLNNVKALLKRIYPELAKTLSLLEEQQLSLLNQKAVNFKSFDVLFEDFALSDDFWDTYKKTIAIKPRYWAQYGTAEISNHWKIKTGLELLVTDKSKGTRKDIEQTLETLRERAKDSFGQEHDMLQWKALRLAKSIHLFKYAHTNASTGVEGLFDPSLKNSFDQEVSNKDEEKENMYVNLEEAESKRQRQLDDVKKQLELRKSEEEAKRKELEALRHTESQQKPSSTAAEVAGSDREGSEEHGDDNIEKKRKASSEELTGSPDNKRQRVQHDSSRTDTAVSNPSILDDLPY